VAALEIRVRSDRLRAKFHEAVRRPDLTVNPPGKKPGDEDLSGWFKLTGLGVEFIAAVAVMGGVGWWADYKLGTEPAFILVGVGVGFAVGLWIIIRAAKQAFK
jgi:F0F1-type ATP synthase assembly protein I